MENKVQNQHKLDILFEGLNNIKIEHQDGFNIKFPVKAEYRLINRTKDIIQCRIEVENIVVYFNEYVMGNIDNAKDYFYEGILTSLMLYRLRVWKESTIQIKTY